MKQYPERIAINAEFSDVKSRDVFLNELRDWLTEKGVGVIVLINDRPIQWPPNKLENGTKFEADKEYRFVFKLVQKEGL